MQEKKNKKVGTKIILVLISLIIVLAVVWWFVKFKVVVKYNNDLEDSTQELRFYSLINLDELKYHLSKKGYTLDNFYETYYLTSEEIEKVKIDSGLEKTICRDGYNLDLENYKCINKEIFNFDNNRIMKNTIVEAIWIKKEEDTEEENSSIIRLSVSKSCILDQDEVTINAIINENINYGSIKWSFPKCYTATKISDTSYKLSRDNESCSSKEELNPKVTASLSLDDKATISFKYEPKMSIKVFDGNTLVKAQNGIYYVYSGSISSNIDVTFKATKKSKTIKSTSNNGAVLYNSVSDKITIKSTCGQSKKINIAAKSN